MKSQHRDIIAYFGILLAFLFLPVTAAGDEFTKALKAHNRGDYTYALITWTRLANAGEIRSQLFVADMYLSGTGVTQDYNEAIAWFTKAAENGEPIAQLQTALLYLTGKGAKRNLRKARQFLEKAADHEWYLPGVNEAQVLLADLYYTGKGGARDLPKAAHWYQQAARRTNAKAKYKLGQLYERGEGVNKDLDKARIWYKRAFETQMWSTLNMELRDKMENDKDLSVYDAFSLSSGMKEANYQLKARMLDMLVDSIPKGQGK